MRALKFGIVGIVVVLAAAFVAGTPRDGGGPQSAHADPYAIQGLNSTICTTLGIAFAGLESVNAIKYCDNAIEQNATDEGLQSFVRCLRGQDTDQDGKRECTQGNNADAPLYEPGIQEVFPEDFATLDRDANQIHEGQSMLVFLYVEDDAPVRFTTNNPDAYFLGVNNSVGGQDYYCETYIDGIEGDPDCDDDPATEGDGVVVAKLALDTDTELGTFTVTGIQEGLGFPMDYTIVGAPEKIQLEPLFGKTVISTGATAPTGTLVGDENDNDTLDKLEDPLPTACNFAATADAVLGANNDAEKVIIVAKALDDDGNEVIGAVLTWDTPFAVTSGYDVSDIAGVSLPQTPTLDTGALGYAFPQFLCGKDEPGIYTAKVTFFTTLDAAADTDEEAEISITVVGPGENIALSVDPPAVDCNGTNAATVTAMVTTADGDNAANGTDVEWSVQALGTANPLVSNTGDGKATTVVTPLSGGTQGVTVIATVGDAQASVLVNCAPGTGTIPPPGETGGGTSGGGQVPITGPDTGSGGNLDGTGSLSIWSAIAMFAGAMGLIGARYATRRA